MLLHCVFLQEATTTDPKTGEAKTDLIDVGSAYLVPEELSWGEAEGTRGLKQKGRLRLQISYEGLWRLAKTATRIATWINDEEVVFAIKAIDIKYPVVYIEAETVDD
mgnify:CR=1 FL=1